MEFVFSLLWFITVNNKWKSIELFLFSFDFIGIEHRYSLLTSEHNCLCWYMYTKENALDKNPSIGNSCTSNRNNDANSCTLTKLISFLKILVYEELNCDAPHQYTLWSALAQFITCIFKEEIYFYLYIPLSFFLEFPVIKIDELHLLRFIRLMLTTAACSWENAYHNL